MQNLTLLYGSFDDSSCQHTALLNVVFVCYQKLGMQVFIVPQFIGWSQQIEEINKQIDILASHIGDQEYRNDIFCWNYSLNKVSITEKRTAFYFSLITLAVFLGQSYFSIFLIFITVSIYPSLLSWSRWVITTIRGRLNILASSMLLVLIF